MEITIHFESFPDSASLNETDKKLVELAKNTSKEAYAVYSNFHVGAAVLLQNGEIILGNNQENIAYPSGLCAERTALFYIGANLSKQRILKMAVYGAGDLLSNNALVTPCGACRQVMAETIHRQGSGFELLLIGVDGRVIKFNNALDLLPLPFGI